MREVTHGRSRDRKWGRGVPKKEEKKRRERVCRVCCLHRRRLSYVSLLISCCLSDLVSLMNIHWERSITGCQLPVFCHISLLCCSRCCSLAWAVGRKSFQLPVFHLLFLFLFFYSVTVARVVGNEGFQLPVFHLLFLFFTLLLLLGLLAYSCLCSIFCSFFYSVTVDCWQWKLPAACVPSSVHFFTVLLGLLAIKTVNCLCSVFSLFLHTVTVARAVGNENCQLHALCLLFLSLLSCCCIARPIGNEKLSTACALTSFPTWARPNDNIICGHLPQFCPLFISSRCCCLPRPVGNEDCQVPVFCALVLSSHSYCC